MYIRKALTTALLSIIWILGLGFMRPQKAIVNSGLNPYTFWSRKLAAPPAYDVVLMGDSRTNNGFSPTVMAGVMKDYRIFNFGFYGCGYNRIYLEAGEKALNPKSARKIIVLGISPLPLTPRAAKENTFVTLRRQDRFQRWFDARFGAITTFFDPYKLKDVITAIRGRSYSTLNYNVYYPDGWASLNILPPTRKYEDDAVNNFIQFFTGNKASAAQEDVVLKFTEKWTRENIRVFGVRQPACKRVENVETNMGGFDEADFIKRFESAGGIWLKFDSSLYITADGSHLDEASARRLSLDLAKEIMSRLAAH